MSLELLVARAMKHQVYNGTDAYPLKRAAEHQRDSTVYDNADGSTDESVTAATAGDAAAAAAAAPRSRVDAVSAGTDPAPPVAVASPTSGTKVGWGSEAEPDDPDGDELEGFEDTCVPTRFAGV